MPCDWGRPKERCQNGRPLRVHTVPTTKSHRSPELTHAPREQGEWASSLGCTAPQREAQHRSHSLFPVTLWLVLLFLHRPRKQFVARSCPAAIPQGRYSPRHRQMTSCMVSVACSVATSGADPELPGHHWCCRGFVRWEGHQKTFLDFALHRRAMLKTQRRPHAQGKEERQPFRKISISSFHSRTSLADQTRAHPVQTDSSRAGFSAIHGKIVACPRAAQIPYGLTSGRGSSSPWL